MSKYHEDGYRLCDQHDCEFPATHTLTWNEHKYYCLIHAEQALKVAGAMGFPTPGRTFRNLTPDEMMPDETPASPALSTEAKS